MFVEGPLYGGKTRGACDPACKPEDFGVTDGSMVDLVVQRRGDTITVNINGKVVNTVAKSVDITSLGIRPCAR